MLLLYERPKKILKIAVGNIANESGGKMERRNKWRIKQNVYKNPLSPFKGNDGQIKMHGDRSLTFWSEAIPKFGVKKYRSDIEISQFRNI